MKQIPLSNSGSFALVSDKDYERVSKRTWRLDGGFGYAISGTTVGHKSVKMLLHREVLQARKGQQVDHRDGNPLNCTRGNLRFSTQSQNRMNSKKIRGCVSQYKGVRRFKRTGQWYTRLRAVHRPRMAKSSCEAYIGIFPDERAAALAYDLWAVDQFGEFAKTNFPVVAHTKKKPLAA